MLFRISVFSLCKRKDRNLTDRSHRPVADVKRFYQNAKLALISMITTIVYIVLGALLFFYLEDCRGQKFPVHYTSNNSLCDICKNFTNNLTTALIHEVKYKVEETSYASCTLNKHSISKWFEFTITTIHTIGYGNTVPHTKLGKIIVIFYSMIGITIALFQYSFVSATILHLVKCTIKTFEFLVLKRKTVAHLKVKILLLTFILFISLLTCAASISNHGDLQGYSWLDSFYFWWITISTIGYGDMRLHLASYVENHPEYVILLFIFTVFGIAMVATTISAIFDITKKEAERRFSRRHSNIEKKQKITKTNRTGEYCSFCRARLTSDLTGEEHGTSLSDINSQLNRNSYASSNYSTSYAEFKSKPKVIENSNRADSQRSMKLISDVEYSDNDDRESLYSVQRYNLSSLVQDEEELQNISPKMVTSTMATTRSSKL